MAAELAPLIVDTPTLAALLDGITVRRVQQLHDDGVLPRVGHGKWDALECVPAFIRHRAAETDEKVASTPAAERMRELKSQDLELRMEERSGALIAEARAEAIAIVDEYAGPLRADLMGIPARVTKDLALRRTLEAEIQAAFGAASKRAAAAGSPDIAGATPPNRAARRAARARR